MALWTLVIVALGLAVTSSDALSVRYSRAYLGKDLGAARSYHAQYYSIARKSGYYTLKHWSSTYDCANYEANGYGDYMGFFSCNQYFEPSTFKYCCGIKGSHYCCPNASLATPYLSDPSPSDPSPILLEGWIIAVIVVTVLVLVLPLLGLGVYCCVAICCLAKATKKRTTVQAAPTMTVSSGAYPAQPQPTGAYGYPMQGGTDGAFPMQQQAAGAAYDNPAAQPTGANPQQPAASNYSQPSDFGYGPPTSQAPPPAYASVTKKM